MMASVWRQQKLLNLPRTIFQHAWVYICPLNATHPAFIASWMHMSPRNSAFQKHLQEPSVHKFKKNKAMSEGNSLNESKIIAPKSSTMNISQIRNGKPNRSLHQKRLPWMDKIHKDLMQLVVLPSKQATVNFGQKPADDFSTNELMSAAMNIKFVDKESMKIIVALWRRLDSMTLEEILATADIFFMNGISVPWYTSALITYLGEGFKFFSFTPLQLTRLVFHISNHGSAPPYLLNDIENCLIENVSNCDINQLAVICQLHFTGQNRIKSPILVDKIADKLLENLDSLHKPQLPMLMKMFRFANYIKISFYKELGDRLVSTDYLKHIQTQSQLMHLAFTYASVRVTHPKLFHNILMQCKEADNQYRLKDIAKIIWACGTLVTSQPESISCIYKILTRLKRNITTERVKEYPDNMLDLLMGLALLKIYPYDLINMVFDPAILKILFGLTAEREKFFQLMFLDHSLTIECPDYSGFRVTEADQLTVVKNVKDRSLEIDLQLRKSVKPAVAALSSAFGADCVQCTFVLPHCQTSDILLAYDASKKLFVKPVTKPLTASRNNHALEQVFNKTQNLVLLLLSRAQTSFDDQPLGLMQCKIRQLKALGYLVIIIDAEEALSYACLEMKATQKMLLGHISATLGTDLSKYLQS